MKTELYKKVFIKSEVDLPKDTLIHVGSKNGFEELVYIENGECLKPFRYDKNDTPTISIKNIDWYLQPIDQTDINTPFFGNSGAKITESQDWKNKPIFPSDAKRVPKLKSPDDLVQFKMHEDYCPVKGVNLYVFTIDQINDLLTSQFGQLEQKEKGESK